MAKDVKLRFRGKSPHIVEGFPEPLKPNDIIEVSPERAKLLLNGLFEKVKKTETSTIVTQNKEVKKEE